MTSDCTMLLSTYDGGEDLWDGFFKALSAQWKNFDMKIVLNTESKSFAYPGFDIKTFNLYEPGQKVTWSKRLMEHLKRIDTEYIFFILDDFWIEEPVDTEFFDKCLQWMRENEDVSNLSFQRTRTVNIKDNRFERFERRPDKAEYKLNCQAALWRREKLLSYLRPHENPWEFEKYGSMRATRYKDGFYTLIEGAPQIVQYDLGGVIYKSRWCRKVVMPLIEKYGIDVDVEKRGFHEDWLESGEKPKRNLIRGIKNRINIIKSLI